MLLEIYGVCYIFEKDIRVDESVKRQRCNWEILPASEMPSKNIEKQLREHGKDMDTYDVFRLDCLEDKEIILKNAGYKKEKG